MTVLEKNMHKIQVYILQDFNEYAIYHPSAK